MAEIKEDVSEKRVKKDIARLGVAIELLHSISPAHFDDEKQLEYMQSLDSLGSFYEDMTNIDEDVRINDKEEWLHEYLLVMDDIVDED